MGSQQTNRARDRSRSPGGVTPRLHSRRRWLAAGDLLRTRLGRSDLAREYYRKGWDEDHSETVLCGQRLIDEHALATEWDELSRLHFEAATDRFTPPRSTDAGRFFNYALTLGDLLPAAEAASLRDTARGVLGEHLRAAPSANLAGQLFGNGNPWPPEVVRDAIYAARRASRGAPVPTEPAVTVTTGTVVAVVTARVSRDLIIATTESVKCWRAANGTVEYVVTVGSKRRVLGLSTDDRAMYVYVLFGEGADLYLGSFSFAKNQFVNECQVKFDNVPGSGSDWYLKPTIEYGIGSKQPPIAVLVSPQAVMTYRGLLLKLSANSYIPRLLSSVCLIANTTNDTWVWDRVNLQCTSHTQGESELIRSPWIPAVPRGSCMTVPIIDWRSLDGVNAIEAVGVTKDGALNWIVATRTTSAIQVKSHAMMVHDFISASLVPSNIVAAVTMGNELRMYDATGRTLRLQGKPRQLKYPSQIVALTAMNISGLIGVLANGSVVRIPRG